MRLNQRKKNQGLKSLRQGSAANGKSLEGRDMLQTFLQAKPRDEVGLVRHRGKSLKGKNNLNPKYGVNHSYMDLGHQLRSNKTLVQVNSELKKKLQSLRFSRGGKQETISRKISTEFEKELYWSGSNSYMISGVKFQYQKMKENLQQKNDELNSILKSTAVSDHQEMLHYLEALEVENNLLANSLEVYSKKINPEPSDSESCVTLSLWLKERVAKGENKISKLREKLKSIKNQNKSLKDKVAFMQRLIIEKDNNEHSALRVSKQREREKDDYQSKYSSLQAKLKETEQHHKQILNDLEKRHKRELKQEEERQADKLREQHAHISRLQRENTYLHNLVASWKEEQTQTMQPKKQRSSRPKIEKSVSLPMEQDNPPPVETYHLPKKVQEKSLKDTIHHHESDREQERSEPYHADKKNSENSVKNRRVKPYELQPIVQWTRFLLIGKGFNISQLLQKFQSEERDEWSQEYINMAEVRRIWIQQACLKEDQALLLSRYLIENADTDHVYTDDINENNRTVVKSIVKNLFGDYPTFSEEQSQEFEKILEENKQKISFTLVNTTKGGIIDKDKFNDLLTSLSLNKNPSFSVYCIGKMTLQSQSLDKLKYECLLKK